MAEEMSPENDGRKSGDWKTRYPVWAWVSICIDGIYIVAVGIAAIIALYLVWCGTAYAWLSAGCTACTSARFNHFAYLVLGGVIGGLLFGMKYFYKVVAHGYWNTDRRPWRLFSPFIAGGLAFAIGALIDSGIFLFTVKTTSNTAYFSIGFITGYFADGAVGKMQAIADHIFDKKHQR